MSVKSRIAAATVLTAAVAAVAYPTATAFAADGRDPGVRPGTTVQHVRLPDGSRASLTSGDGGARVTVTSHGKEQRTFDAGRPTADLDRLHLRILGGDGDRPTLRARLDGSSLTNYYDFTSGSLRHTPEATGRPAAAAAPSAATAVSRTHDTPGRAAAGKDAGHATRAATAGRPPHDSSGNPVRRVVEAGHIIKASHDAGDVGTPAVAAGVALVAVVGGAYGVRVALRRYGRTAD
ncbi:hypothetical protein [Streptomyces cinnamoneus]|uniref:Uncharacterized protein n=1 Tax=Streptomyces cinnamoneus TaxID=53446 RepID=A0A918TRG1_STRCJ|nr:hypothetical protein [Streptomyces cinnamoneus]GHC55894.1 hypothetical protein GCM10010507_35480 [Streptomyces cinnamoneus]